MVGRGTWRRGVAFVLSVAACSFFLFASVASHSEASGGFLERVRSGVRSLTGGAFEDSYEAPSVTARSGRAMALEASALVRDKTLLQIAGGPWDPAGGQDLPENMKLPSAFLALAPRLELVPPALAAEGDYEYVIYQYDGDSTAGRARDELEKADGIEIMGFVPNAAFLVRAEPGAAAALNGLEHVRTVLPYHPSFKVTEDIRGLLNAGDTSALPLDGAGNLRLSVNFHAGVDSSAYSDMLSSLPGTKVNFLHQEEDPDSVVGGIAQILVQPGRLQSAVLEIANMRDVVSIWHDEIPTPHINHSIWFNQTGITDLGPSNLDTTAKLFALGITGQGLIGSVADSGLENDMCFFRYSAALKDVGWPVAGEILGGTREIETSDLEGGAIYSRARKLVAYYVGTGATAYSDDGQHGTGVAGCAVGDNFGHVSSGGALASLPLVRNLNFGAGLTALSNVLSCERTDGEWAIGDLLRGPELAAQVDRPDVIDAAFASNPYGANVQHHDDRDGMAPGAQLVFFDIGDDNGGLVGQFTQTALMNMAVFSGATTFNASFGGGPCTACYQSGIGGDISMWRHRQMVGFSSAGNSGDQGIFTVTSGFAQAINFVTVGATVEADNAGAGVRRGHDRADFSSVGPASGGTLKPEIVAPGGGLVVVATTNNPIARSEDGTGTGNNECYGPQTPRVNGTSFSSPTASGLGLLIQQYFLDGFYPSGVAEAQNAFRPTNALVKAVLINSARNMTGNGTADDGVSQGDRPTNAQGWGAPVLDDTLFFGGDPTNDDIEGDEERARFLILTDTPNGVTGLGNLSDEPGGLQRADIFKAMDTSITDGRMSVIPINILNDDPTNRRNELRVTLCWSDPAPTGGTQTVPLVNDLDLELESPSGIIYRTDPSSAWDGGYTQPAADQIPQEFNMVTGFTDYPDADRANNCENVFIAAENVETGNYTIRVVGYRVPGAGGSEANATPNFVLNDRPSSIHAPGTVCTDPADLDEVDIINPRDQGYALILSGNFTTTQGLVSLNRSNFDCSGEQELFVTVNDENGFAAPDDPVACDPVGSTLEVTLRTSTPSPAFPSDLEIIELEGPEPTFTNVEGLPVVVVSDAAQVIHGDGIVQVVEGFGFTVTYDDVNPCGGTSFTQASLSCRPVVADSGFDIQDGCDLREPGNPASQLDPDEFMDFGERNRYTVFFLNNGADDLHDAVVSLTPDPDDPFAGDVNVLNSPQHAGLAPPGRRSDTTFLVEIDPASLMGPRYSMDFIVCISSPADGLLFPDCFTQTQRLEADVESFRYDTRDPNGELFGLGRIERRLPGVEEGSLNAEDYFTNDPMWFDPDGDCGAGPGSCAAICDIPRSDWDAANLMNPGTGANPPFECFINATDNPFDPWDFEDDDEGFIPTVYSGDQNLVGPPVGQSGSVAQEYFWKAGDLAGGCGYELDLQQALLDSVTAAHPDAYANPYGIWHTGAINQAEDGPVRGATPQSQGVPFLDDEDDPFNHTIVWDMDIPGETNEDRQWCDSYLNNTSLSQFYRSMLKSPTLHKVHASNPEFRVEFEELRYYARLDGHTIDGDNLTIKSWGTSNQPIDTLGPGADESGTWGQYQYLQLIYSDNVRPDWDAEFNIIAENLRSLNEDFPDLSYEDLYGPADTSWNFHLGWAMLFFDGLGSRGQYGSGIDDVSFIWTESRDVDDQGDCFPGGMGIQPATVFFSETRYNACAGALDIVVIDPNQVTAGTNELAVCVTSASEDVEVAVLTLTPEGRYQGQMPFDTNPENNAVGTLLVDSGQRDVGNGNATVRVEYDPDNGDWDPDHPDGAEGICDWQDIAPADGENDTDINGDIIAEDDMGNERADTSVINCTSGVIFYLTHTLQEEGAGGDGDYYADPGETHWLSLELASQLGSDLEDVTITISTDDPTVCIKIDTVTMDILPGNNTLIETPIDPVGLPGRQGFQFSVPAEVQSTDLDDGVASVRFRVDVEGINSGNLNEFSTRGNDFATFLPMEAKLFLDLDPVATTADYDDNQGSRTGRPIGTFFEGFEASAPADGFEHFLLPNVFPGIIGGSLPGAALDLDGSTDTRWGADMNGGFCPECDINEDCKIEPAVPADEADCDHPFVPPYPEQSQWKFTNDWAHTGTGAMKFGKPDAGPDEQDQRYAAGQFTAFQLPPMRITTDESVTPELTFWQIADFWRPSFTGGLVTPVGAGVVEISANAEGLGWGAGGGFQNTNRAIILDKYPTSSFRRLFAYEEGYDNVTDAMNACRTQYCGWHHPVTVNSGNMLEVPSDPTDPRNPSPARPVGTWEEVRIDLSDYRGQEIALRWVVSVPQDFNMQPGQFGWLVDDIEVTGLSLDMGVAIDTRVPGSDPCGIVAEFTSTSADCFGDEVIFFDRHSGVGSFDGTTGEPFPIEYEWTIAGTTFRDFGDIPVLGVTGVRGNHKDPTIRLSELAGVAGPGAYDMTLNLYQDGNLVGTFTDTVIYKDLPVPVITAPALGPFVDGTSSFTSTVSVAATPDPARTFTYEWDFGDGTPVDASGASVNHSYTAPGLYDVTLCVIDEDGCVGCSTTQVDVVAAPEFVFQSITLTGECADPTHPGLGPTGLGDGDPDYNEQVSIDIGVTNNGADANAVTGYLTSVDRDVEILKGISDYGDILGGANGLGSFTFIRRPNASDSACLVIPFTLTLAGSGGVVEVVELSYTMGGELTVPGPGVPLDGTNCLLDGTVFNKPAIPTGCVTSMSLDMTVSGIGLATRGVVRVALLEPGQLAGPNTGRTIYAGDGTDTGSDVHICFTFDETSELVDCAVPPTLASSFLDIAASELTGVPMFDPVAGPDQWRILVEGIPNLGTPDCFSIWDVRFNDFTINGKESVDLDDGLEAICADCLDSTEPIYNGLTAECTTTPGIGLLSWTPVQDTSGCEDDSQIEYRLFGSTTDDQLGTEAMEVANCADCMPGDFCYLPKVAQSSQWEVCDVEGVYWTLVVTDDGDVATQVPTLDTANAAAPVPAGYQTDLEVCAVPPTGLISHFIKASNGDLEAWAGIPADGLTRNYPGTTPANQPHPDPIATDYTVWRGTLPAFSGILTYDYGTPPAGGDVVCRSVGPVLALAPQPTGSYFYIMAAESDAGCAGMGYQGTPNGGGLEFINPRDVGVRVNCGGGDCAAGDVQVTP